MILEKQRIINTALGSMLLIFSFLCLGTTTYLALNPLPAIPAPVSGVPTIDKESCRSLLGQLGYNTSVSNGEVQAQLAPDALEDPQNQLRVASMGISACKLNLKKFCMGTACETPGLSFSLTSNNMPKPASAPPAPPVNMEPTPPANSATPAKP